MVDIDMQEMDCFKFIKSVQLIKDLPIILISAESKKNVVEEAMMKGACFFLKKPISSKNLKNVWQHVYRKNNHKNARKIVEIKSGGDDREEGNENVFQIVNGRIGSNEKVGDSGRARSNDRGGLVGGTTKSRRVGKKRPLSSPENPDERKEMKRRRSDDEGSELSQNSHRQRIFSTTN
ncbi:hypothetical protein C2S52_016309 [Perilla frutescens var. hirtella]|nr:hypothetical protein C2S52_016309 [Perilla frutescens var. hirtella]